MKNAGKACNNRLYRHIRTFEKIVKNYFVIFIKHVERGRIVKRVEKDVEILLQDFLESDKKAGI